MLKRIFVKYIALTVLTALLITNVTFAEETICPCSENVLDTGKINVVINGVKQNLDNEPIIENSRVLVPVRDILEALDVSVKWDEETEKITCLKGQNTVELFIGSETATVNGENVVLDTEPQLINDSTYIPLRFMGETFGNNVEWNEKTQTVSLITMNSEPHTLSTNSSEAIVASTVKRRNVPTNKNFSQTNQLDDLIFAPNYRKDADISYELPEGTVIYSMEEYLDSNTSKWSTDERGKTSAVNISGQTFKKALRITTTKAPGNSLFSIYPSTNVIKTKINAEDRFYLTFKIRTISGGDTNGNGRITPFIQTKGWIKVLETEVFAGSEWETYYLSYGGVEDANEIGIFISNFVQTVEIGGFEIIKLDDPNQSNMIPDKRPLITELSEGAKWRKDAVKRIEEIRKGDFFVTVCDADGNPLRDAKVTFNMFEHEFMFGSMGAEPMTTYANEEWARLYSPRLGKLFNTMVVGNEMKWYQYLLDPDEARKQINVAKDYGVRNFRGHTLFWPISSNRTEVNENLIVIPPVLFEYLDNNDRASFDNMVKEHIFSECAAFTDVCRWDVVNEISDRDEFEKGFGADIYKNMFDWARQATPEGTKLVWNDYPNPGYKQEMLDMIQKFKDMNVDYDVIGIQCHNDSMVTLKPPTQWLELYNELASKSGKELEITEYSANGTDPELQAAYLRDMMIAAFSHEAINGFTLWGFCDVWSGGNSVSIYDSYWHKKPGYDQYVDLVYNKWWTKNATANTNCSGRCRINGFYGDYDIKVSYNGKSKTVSAKFYKDDNSEVVIMLD